LIYKRNSLIKRIEKLREYFVDLEKFRKITYEEYIKDKRNKYTVERLLFLIAENILDFLDHVLAIKYEIISDSYEEVIENAYKKDLISKNLYKKIKGLGKFRNILAHEYLELKDEEVFKNFKKMLQIKSLLFKELENRIN